jgi:hypothetical protein
VSTINLPEQIDLQLALIFIGAIIIIAIIIYNIARANKAKSKKDQPTSQDDSRSLGPAVEDDATSNGTSSQDHAFDVARKEPSLGSFNATESSRAETIPEQTTSSLGQSSGSESVIHPQTIEPFKTSQYVSRIDPNIDCVVAFRFSLPVSGSEIIECIQNLSKNDDFRIAFEGLTESSSYAGSVNSSWELIQFNNTYRELQASIQLANRRGPLGPDHLGEFIGLVQSISQELDAEIDLPPIHDILNDATDLDQFAIQCDIQLGFNLTSNMMSWQCADIQNILLGHGFILSREGSSFNYILNDELLFKAQVSGLNFLRDDLQTTRINQVYFSFDVPLIAEELNPFIKMLEIGQTLAQELDGRLLDDNGQALSVLLTQHIQNQIAPIYQLMRERNIEPGSPTALRLFN